MMQNEYNAASVRRKKSGIKGDEEDGGSYEVYSELLEGKEKHKLNGQCFSVSLVPWQRM
jgi:hypothetical protein